MNCTTYIHSGPSGTTKQISGTTCLGIVSAYTLTYGQEICMDNTKPLVNLNGLVIGSYCTDVTPTPTPTNLQLCYTSGFTYSVADFECPNDGLIYQDTYGVIFFSANTAGIPTYEHPPMSFVLTNGTDYATVTIENGQFYTEFIYPKIDFQYTSTGCISTTYPDWYVYTPATTQCQITPTPSITPTLTKTSTPTPNPTNTPTPSITATITPTITLTQTPTITPSATPTITPTNSLTPTTTQTPTTSVTPTITNTNTQTQTPSNTPTNTPTSSITPTITQTPTKTVTPTVTPTISLTPTNTITPSITPTKTITPTITLTPTITPTSTNTPTISLTPTITNSNTPTNTPSITPSITPTITITLTTTPTVTPTITLTPSITPTQTITPTKTSSPTPTPTLTQNACLNYGVSGTTSAGISWVDCSGNTQTFGWTGNLGSEKAFCAQNGTPTVVSGSPTIYVIKYNCEANVYNGIYTGTTCQQVCNSLGDGPYTVYGPATNGTTLNVRDILYWDSNLSDPLPDDTWLIWTGQSGPSFFIYHDTPIGIYPPGSIWSSVPNCVCPTQTPTPTITSTPTLTPTNTTTPTLTPTNTTTPTITITPTITDTPTNTPTPTITDTPTNTPTNTITITPTITPTITNTQTETPTNTPTVTQTPTITPTISITPSITPTQTSNYISELLYTGSTACDACGQFDSIQAYWPSSQGNTLNVGEYVYTDIGLTNPMPDGYYVQPSVPNAWIRVNGGAGLIDQRSPTGCSTCVTPTPTPTISLTPSITPTISLTPSITPTITPSVAGKLWNNNSTNWNDENGTWNTI